MRKGKKQKYKQQKFSKGMTTFITTQQLNQKIAKLATEYDNEVKKIPTNEGNIHKPENGSSTEQQPANNLSQTGNGQSKPAYYGGWEGYEGD